MHSDMETALNRRRGDLCAKSNLQSFIKGELGTNITNAKIFRTCRGELRLFVTGIYLDDRG